MAAAILKGGEGGLAVMPWVAAESLLVERIAEDDPTSRMPPEAEPLKADEVAAIRAWIAAGAGAPEGEPVPSHPVPLVVPPAPQAGRARRRLFGREPDRCVPWRRTPGTRAWGARPRAGKAELLRRVVLDLTGLAPLLERCELSWPKIRPSRTRRSFTACSPARGSASVGVRRPGWDGPAYSDWDGFNDDIYNNDDEVDEHKKSKLPRRSPR